MQRYINRHLCRPPGDHTHFMCFYLRHIYSGGRGTRRTGPRRTRLMLLNRMLQFLHNLPHFVGVISTCPILEITIFYKKCRHLVKKATIFLVLAMLTLFPSPHKHNIAAMSNRTNKTPFAATITILPKNLYLVFLEVLNKDPERGPL